MKTLTSSEIRQMWLDYWAEKGHEVYASQSLVPVDDPTLLWINSGVATLKKFFDGTEQPNNPRITNSQKSIRTNDIENVGVTARHHTLFEMLGNFSIGDYFKEEAIPWAWEFLTSEKWLALDPEKLYATYYPEDEETKQIWLEKVGLPEDHLISEPGNFWDIGSGPCGPDTEIFYDRGVEYQDLEDSDPEMYPGGENERYLEIWNLVFSQYNHMADGSYEPLPQKNVDTGMGLERIVSVLQDTPTNFETDLFMPIIKEIEELSDIKYGDDTKKDISFKVIADHLRAVSFAIGDNALPSNEGRGYILRRLIRRAVMHGRRLGINDKFLTSLVPVVGNIMASQYPEINDNLDFIQQVIGQEEARFHETIDEGESIIEDLFKEMKEEGQTEVDGAAAFKLYDTYGFPLELTEEYAEDHGYTVDRKGFDVQMEAQRTRARDARADEASMNVQSEVLRNLDVESEFVGYETAEANSELAVIILGEKKLETLEAGQEADLVFTVTPFYAEMGGQVADTGVILSENGDVLAEVVDVKKAPQGQFLHHVKATGKLKAGQTYQLQIDEDRRRKITYNHTGTHLLHQALKDVLGDHANQAGSLVTPNQLRFDFTHFGQVTPEELQEMESIVNQKIWANLTVETNVTDITTAKEMGAMALFGEKYGSEVRVVKVGDYSIELCGGIHVKSTSEIGLFKIKSESGIGAGVRRIEAVTSAEAFAYLEEAQDKLIEVAKVLKVKPQDDIAQRVQGLQSERRALQSEVDSLKAQILNQESANIFDNVEEINGFTLIVNQGENRSMDDLRQLADQWKQGNHSDVFATVSAADGKVNAIIAVDDKAIKAGIKAGDLIKASAPAIGGGGGGRPNLAQAGGKKPAGIEQFFDLIRESLSK